VSERIDIANLALSWLGEDDITSLEDANEKARQMRINYIPARDATLEAHEWSFAIKRFVPGQVTPEPVFGVSHKYSIPADIIRVLSVEFGTGNVYPIGSEEQVDWVMEGGYILCDENVIYCRGIQRIEQEGKFSPLFVHALAAKLASLTAIVLTASADIQANMLGLYERFIMQAKTRDGMQGRSRRVRNRSLLKSR
jgi:hypothetical protein